MSALIKLGLLSFLSTAVLAAPVESSSAAPYPQNGYGREYPSGSYAPSGTGRSRHRHRIHRLTTTSTRTSTAVQTEYVTVSPSAAPAQEYSPEGEAAAEQPSSSPCPTPTVYETQHQRVTVTVEHAYNAPQQTPAAVSYESAPVAPAGPAQSQITYDGASSKGDDVSAASESNPLDGATITFHPVQKEVLNPLPVPVVGSVNVPNQPAAAVENLQPAVAVENLQPAAAVKIFPTTSTSRKRGVAYNDLQYTGCFATQSKVSWAYNWGQVPGNGLSNNFEYVPMLWGTRSDFTANWVDNARAAINSGSGHILGFNEPDHSAQSNMDPYTAASAYMTHIHDNFAGSGVRLGSPAVTNGGGNMGLNWLSTFLGACSGCQIDFVAIHWYDSATNIDYFKNHVTQAHQMTGKPVWITEFGADGSDAEVTAFLQQVLPWLDSQGFVERYSYFMARDGLLNSGTDLSTHGRTFASY